LRTLQLATGEHGKEHVAMRSTEFSIKEFGDLLIALTARGKADLERLLTQHPDWDDAEVFTELIEKGKPPALPGRHPEFDRYGKM
jgi:hypothetical protein